MLNLRQAHLFPNKDIATIIARPILIKLSIWVFIMENSFS